MEHANKISIDKYSLCCLLLLAAAKNGKSTDSKNILNHINSGKLESALKAHDIDVGIGDNVGRLAKNKCYRINYSESDRVMEIVDSVIAEFVAAYQ